MKWMINKGRWSGGVCSVGGGRKGISGGELETSLAMMESRWIDECDEKGGEAGRVWAGKG